MTMPNFLIIGAAKAGTTSLYHYIRQHPGIFMPSMKEPCYYCDDHQATDVSAVRARRAYEVLFDGVNGARAIGEASTRYLNAIAGVERIHRDLPGVRLIVSLRQPADRAYSSYLGRRAAGVEPARAELALRRGNYAVETSFYYPRLRRFYDRFSREQIKVTLFDDLVARPRETLRELFRFLGVDPDVPLDTTVRHNAVVGPRFARLNRAATRAVGLARPMAPRWLLGRGLSQKLFRPLLAPAEPFDPALRRRLSEEYRDDVRATGELIGRDLSHWLA